MPFLYDNLGRLKGRVDEDASGRKIYDSLGRYKGSYQHGSTYDELGRYVGQGDFLSSLLDK